MLLCVGLVFEVQSMHKGYESRCRASAAFDKSCSQRVIAIPTMNTQEIPYAVGIKHFDVSPEQAIEEGVSQTYSNSSIVNLQKEHNEHRKTLVKGIMFGAGALCFAVSFFPKVKEGFCNGK